ncbi:hypothetical protein [Listeria booriae]|uniref:hypothetical protein n=1 Tax=Listeria booriae TaxID=1552123 RepID=UPI0016232D6E|nr:hypothetical protein [Listeria booriae]MBC1290598.1 hypothetical protein [Listeria booriae]
MSEVKVYCRFERGDILGIIDLDKVLRVKADYIKDYKGLKICVRMSDVSDFTQGFIVFDAGSGAMISSDADREKAIEQAFLKLDSASDVMINRAKKQHNFYGIPAMRIGMNIIPMNTLLGNKHARKTYERRTGERFELH